MAAASERMTCPALVIDRFRRPHWSGIFVLGKRTVAVAVTRMPRTMADVENGCHERKQTANIRG